MEGLMNLFISFANWFWGPPILMLIGFGGVYLTLMTGFVQVRHFPYIVTQTFGEMFQKVDRKKILMRFRPSQLPWLLWPPVSVRLIS